MNVVIIEDEQLAANHLITLLKDCSPDLKIKAIIDSVEQSVTWLQNNEQPPLIFMDIQLGDGVCFDIFKQVEIKSFVIFTTAYDKYAIQAFKVNSIDYILKPLQKDELKAALNKFNHVYSGNEEKYQLPQLEQLIKALTTPIQAYKERFVVKVGVRIRIIEVKDIACVYSFEKGTFIQSNDGKQYLIDFTLDRLMNELKPEQFFRANRKYIVNLNAVEEVVTLGPLRLKIKLKQNSNHDIIVSREKVKIFKSWLEGE